jgi:CRISPR-associated exonuclease Cas4
MYEEDDMLMLSGIQHFVFCPRQWALIHLEQQWADNKLTMQGQILHTNVDNPFYRQKNGDVITLRSVHLASRRLGLYGISDAVELLPSDSPDNSITHERYAGYWRPFPVEYKRGRRKPNECDEVQLAAQVMCLEEMYGIHIPYAALYYNEVKHRETISISDTLRQTTQRCADKMHEIYKSQVIPDANKHKFCKSCSLKDICLPETNDCAKVANYLKRNLYEDIT